MKFKVISIFLFMAGYFYSDVLAESIPGLSGKIKQLEDDVFELKVQQSGKKAVRVFDALNLSLGGQVTSTFTTIFGNDTSTQSIFDGTKFRILFSADISDRLNLFLNPDFVLSADYFNAHRGSREYRKISLTQRLMIARLTYEESSNFNFLLGRYITPFGLLNMEHWDALFLSDIEPIFMRHMHHDHIFPRHLIGGQIFGKFPSESKRFEYFLYTGTYDDVPSDIMGGGKLIWNVKENALSIGISNFLGRGEDAFYDAVGTEVDFQYKAFGLKSEVVYRSWDRKADRIGMYVQPALTFGNFIVFGRTDYWDEALNRHPSNDEQRFEHMIGLNWLPIPLLRNRLIWMYSDYSKSKDTNGGNRNFYEIHASFTTSF